MTNLINRLYRSNGFPLVPQLLSLSVFILLIIGGFSAQTDDMAFAKVLRNTNLANLIVWSYWWPLIIVSAVFLGRIWCAVCPMELVTFWAAKIGLKRKPPEAFRSGWVITAFYVGILFVGVHVLAIHRFPFRMALFMLLLLVTAVGSGLLFSRNTFCAHICPVGHLLGLYARLAPFGFGVKDRAVCKTCSDKSCVSNKTAYLFQGRSCGVGLRPTELADNSDCLLCGQCLKACDRNKPDVDQSGVELGRLAGKGNRPNPGWFSRPWFNDVLTLKSFSAAQAVFCIVVSGFVIYELFTEWTVTKDLLLWLPKTIGQGLSADGPWATGLVKSLTLFVGVPVVLWLLPFGLVRLLGSNILLTDFVLRFGIAFVPIMAAAHCIKALLKMTSRLPYWQYAVSDTAGEATAAGILDKTITLAALPVWRETSITVLSLVLMGGGIAVSLVVIRRLLSKHCPGSGWRNAPLYLIPGLYGGGFFAMLSAWRFF